VYLEDLEIPKHARGSLSGKGEKERDVQQDGLQEEAAEFWGWGP